MPDADGDRRRPSSFPGAGAEPSSLAARRGGTVCVEAEWDSRDPIGEMMHVTELRQMGLPSAAAGQAWLDRADAGQGQPANCARHPGTVRCRALHVRRQLPGRQPVFGLRRDPPRLAAIVADFSEAQRRAQFAENGRRLHAIADCAPQQVAAIRLAARPTGP